MRSVWLCREHQCHLTSTGMSTKESSARRVLDEGRELTEYISYLEMRSLFDKHMHRLLFCKFATLAVGMQPAGHVTCTCGIMIQEQNRLSSAKAAIGSDELIAIVFLDMAGEEVRSIIAAAYQTEAPQHTEFQSPC